MRVLITGGAGFIGAHTAKALAVTGIEPVVFDNLSTGHLWACRWGPLVVGELTDAALLRATMLDYGISAVIHLAGSAYVGESMTRPTWYFHNNVEATLNLLSVMLEVGVEHIVFSSSCAVYGNPPCLPIVETSPTRPANPYGESKLIIERILHWYEQAYGLHWAALRYFNAAGADPAGEIGEHHLPETHLIPLVIRAACDQHTPVKVFGTDYATKDGTAVRDYVHVTDLADAHAQSLSYLMNGGPSQPFNLGTGRGYSVREIIAEVESVSGMPVTTQDAARRLGDPPALIADARHAAQILNWCPRYSDLSTMVGTAWSWSQNQPTMERVVPPLAHSLRLLNGR